jgi:hypothetical protein
MVVTIISLVLAAVCTLPGTVSPGTETGRKIMRAFMLPLGVAGAVLFVAGPALLVAGIAVSPAGGLLSLLTLLLSGAAVLCTGVILGFGLIVRASSRRASPETVERTETRYREVARFLPVLGLFCLLLAGWGLLVAFVIPPVAPPAPSV